MVLLGDEQDRVEVVVVLFAGWAQIEVLADKAFEYLALDGVGKADIALYIYSDGWLFSFMLLDVFLAGDLLVD